MPDRQWPEEAGGAAVVPTGLGGAMTGGAALAVADPDPAPAGDVDVLTPPDDVGAVDPGCELCGTLFASLRAADDPHPAVIKSAQAAVVDHAVLDEVLIPGLLGRVA